MHSQGLSFVHARKSQANLEKHMLVSVCPLLLLAAMTGNNSASHPDLISGLEVAQNEQTFQTPGPSFKSAPAANSTEKRVNIAPIEIVEEEEASSGETPEEEEAEAAATDETQEFGGNRTGRLPRLGGKPKPSPRN